MADSGLEDLLLRGRRALLCGDLAALAPLTAELGTLLEGADWPEDPRDLAAIRGLAHENARLLTAAREGLRSARASLAQSRGPAFSPYDIHGRRVALPAAPSAPPRRL